jgi:hypothetical protein
MCCTLDGVRKNCAIPEENKGRDNPGGAGLKKIPIGPRRYYNNKKRGIESDIRR